MLVVAVNEANEVSLTWGSSLNASGYAIERKLDGVASPLAAVAAPSTTYTDLTAARDTLYVYSVRATRDALTSAPVEQTVLSSPQPAGNLVAQSLSISQVALSWDDTNQHESGYTVERAAPGQPFSAIGVLPADAVGFIDAGLGASSVFDYRIATTNAAGTVRSASVSGGTLDPSPLPGESCAHASAPIGSTTSFTGQSTGSYANDYGAGTGCLGTSGPDRVYGVTVPVGRRLSASIHPHAAWNPSLSIVQASACDVAPRACVTSADAFGDGLDESVAFDNIAATATYFVIVDSATAGGDFDLSIALDAFAGETCGNAIAFGPSGVTGSTTVGYANDYAPGHASCCGTTFSGGDKVYAVVLPAGQTLTATVTPTTPGADPALYLLDVANCTTQTQCADCADSNLVNGAETLSHVNSTGVAIPLYLVVDAFSGSYAFSLSVTIN